MDKTHRTALSRMAASVLRPLIKVLLRHNFAHSDLTELVRKTYVEVAYDAFKLPEQKMTYSRAALLTGLSRKEVVRLRSHILEQISVEPELEPTNVSQQVVHGWMSDKAYLDSKGEPKALAMKGEGVSFETLVRKYSVNESYAVVLTDLSKNGMTSQSSDGVVNLVSSGYIPQYDELEKIRVMSVCVSDLFGTAVHNVDPSSNDIRFQRQLVYSGIEESLARKFHDVSNDKAVALLDTLNEFLFSECAQPDSELRRTGKRVGLGIYYFEGAKQVKSVKMTSEEHA